MSQALKYCWKVVGATDFPASYSVHHFRNPVCSNERYRENRHCDAPRDFARQQADQRPADKCRTCNIWTHFFVPHTKDKYKLKYCDRMRQNIDEVLRLRDPRKVNKARFDSGNHPPCRGSVPPYISPELCKQ